MRRHLVSTLCFVILAVQGPSAAEGAEHLPSLTVTSLPTPTNFAPGDESGEPNYDLRIANVGGAATHGAIVVTDALPNGLTVKNVSMTLRSNSAIGINEYAPEACQVTGPPESQVVTCEISAALPGATEPEVLQPAEERRIVIQVKTPNPPEGALPLENTVTVEGGGAPPATVTTHNEVNAEPAEAGISLLQTLLKEADGQSAELAASHPFQFVVGFAVNTKKGPPGAASFVPAGGDLRDTRLALPSGLIGNPNVATRCTPVDFNNIHTVNLGTGAKSAFFSANACPDSSAVGVMLVQQIEGEPGSIIVPIYNLVPPPGMPAEFGAQVLSLPFYIKAEVLPDQDYKVYATLENLTQIKRLTAATVMIWGTPADPTHDPLRGSCLNTITELFPIELESCKPQGTPPPYRPFLRMPTNCLLSLNPIFSFDSWTNPGTFVSRENDLGSLSGCETVPFESTMHLHPDSNVADSPIGLDADVHLPQPEESEEQGEADLRKTVVTLPRGVSINPSGANGLDACSLAQIGLKTSAGVSPALFSNGPANCPPAARVGTATVRTPLVDHPLEGDVYVASPHENPFGTLLAIYIAVDDPVSGVVVKLPGEVRADPVTGQLTATFDETPQVPFEDFELSFFGGRFAALRSPSVCGNYETQATLTPWSAPFSASVSIHDPFSVDAAPAGGPCPTSPDALPNSPLFSAGSLDSTAGSYSPFVMSLRREDGSQEIAGLTVKPPPGLLASLRGIPYCSEHDLAVAATRSGAAELQNASCPDSSKVGTVAAAAGAGPAPYHQEGKVYLAGPYKGAPLSLAAITPAVAGPYDLGNIVVRVALHVNPETAVIEAVSDPIPSILQGIPLDVRSLVVKLDRLNFTVNPTNCEKLAVEGKETSTLGQVAPLSDRFQVGGCDKLKFKPKLAFFLSGGTKRSQNPALKAVFTNPSGSNANLRGLRVTLPHALFLDNEHFQTICTRVQFAANSCPKRSVYGHARAFSPLLDKPLEGPVFLRSSSHSLPDLVADLKGQIEVVIDGRIDSTRGRIRNTFEALPDAPVSKVVLSLAGGKRGILVNSRNLCTQVQKVQVRFAAQNGKVLHRQPPLKTRCAHKR